MTKLKRNAQTFIARFLLDCSDGMKTRQIIHPSVLTSLISSSIIHDTSYRNDADLVLWSASLAKRRRWGDRYVIAFLEVQLGWFV